MTVTIASLADGMMVDGLNVLVAEKRVGTAKNGKQYGDLVVRDKTASIKCKIWDFQDSPVSPVKAGSVIRISGKVGAFAGELQFTISTIGEGTGNPQEFAKTSRFDINLMTEKIHKVIDDFTEPMTKYVAKNLTCWEIFKQAPAAIKMHNAWYGGLVEHIYSMLANSLPVIKHYQIYAPKLSADKVRFGIIAHDVGKMYEYSYSTPAFGMSPQGLLCNHLVTGPCMVFELCNKWFKEQNKQYDTPEFIKERDHLVHIVASHHGTLEFGSPVVPSTLEAVLVHQFDMLDSKFMHALELTEGKEGQVPGFSERSWAEKTSYMLYK